nr:MAG TPA: hypothetical protein [Caudoviricetes sp.]
MCNTSMLLINEINHYTPILRSNVYQVRALL